MIPGRDSAALILNWPNSNAKALSLFLIHSFRPFSSLGGSPSNDAAEELPAPHHQAIMLQ